MESQFINYAQPLVSTLKNAATVQIVSRLVAQPDDEKELKKLINEINDLEKPNRFVLGCYNFSKVEEIIQKKLTLLCIPKPLHAEILNFVKPIGLLLIKCIDLRGTDYNRLNFTFKGTFYWTARGTIDKIRTLERQVFRNSQEISLGILFGFAHQYCCENCIFEIWKRIPEDKKENYFRSSMVLCYISSFSYWGYRLENKKPDFRNHINLRRRTDSIHSVMLESAILRENFLAAKYFWNKLPQEERTNDNILRWLEQVIKSSMLWYKRQVPSELTDIMLYLLSHLSDQALQKRFFKKYPEVILKSLYNHWPHQVYFLPTIKVMWDYLEENLYVELVSIMAAEAKERNMSRELLRELWYCSPEKFKNRVEFSEHWEITRKLIDIDTTGNK